MHGFNALRGLHSQRGNGRDAVTIVRGDGFQVCRDARARGWIESGDRQHDRRCHIHMIGQFFEPFREKTRLQTNGPAAEKKRRASRHVEMYACVRPRAIEIFK